MNPRDIFNAADEAARAICFLEDELDRWLWDPAEAGLPLDVATRLRRLVLRWNEDTLPKIERAGVRPGVHQ